MDEHIHWKKLDYNHDPTLLQMHTPEIVDSSTSTSTPPNPSASSPTKSTCLDKRNLRLPHLNLLSRYATKARHVQSHTTQRSTSDNTITINTKHPSRTCILNPQTNHRGHVRGKKRRNRAPRDDCNIPAVRHRVHLLSPFFRNRVPIRVSSRWQTRILHWNPKRRERSPLRPFLRLLRKPHLPRLRPQRWRLRRRRLR